MTDDVFADVFGFQPSAAPKTKKADKGEWHPETKPLPPAKKPKPDAVVLCIIHTRCLSCGATSEYPSSHLLHRYGPRAGQVTFQWTSAAADQYPSGTKYEIIHHDITNANCLRCFRPFVRASIGEAPAFGARETSPSDALSATALEEGGGTVSERRDSADEISLSNPFDALHQRMRGVREGS